MALKYFQCLKQPYVTDFLCLLPMNSVPLKCAFVSGVKNHHVGAESYQGISTIDTAKQYCSTRNQTRTVATER